MSENTTSTWMTAAVVSALVLVATIGSVFAIRERLMAQMHKALAEEAAAREKLANKLADVESKLEGFSTTPKIDGAALEAMQTQLSETNGKLEALAARADNLEKQLAEFKPMPVAAPVEAAPKPDTAAEAKPTSSPTSDAELVALIAAAKSGKPFADELAAYATLRPEQNLDALRDTAPDGIASETALAKALLEIIGNKHATQKIDDTSTVGKINTHLKGLVTIQKANVKDAYSELRKDAAREDIETLIRRVERLDDADRAPLEDWLKQAKQRRDALEMLDILGKASR